MQCWPPRRKFPCSLRERYKILKFFEIFLFQFSSKWSYGHQECSDYNLNQEFLTEGRIFFAQCTKILMKHWIQKIDLHEDPIVSVNAVLTTPPKLSLQSPRMIKNSYFFRKIHFLFFLNTLWWTRRMQWLQLRRRVFDERPKSFRSMYKNVKKTYNSKNDLHKDPIVLVNAVLTTPPKLSLQSPRMIKNLYFFRKNQFLFFLNTFWWTRRMQWLQVRRRVFDERPKIFPSVYKNFKETYNSKNWSA